MKSFYRIFCTWVIIAAISLSSFGCALIPSGSPDATTDGGGNDDSPDISSATILYTNDIHAYIEGGEALTYGQLADLKKALQLAGEAVIAVDAGDHIQGSVYGAMDKGMSVLDMMNEVYDLATIGNHEFDYGMERTLELTASAEYPYISCNFVTVSDGETVLDPYKILEVGEYDIGFVGITTPEAIANTAPACFQDENGNYIYDILAGEELYAAVQSAIDELTAIGVDRIIALAHLGVDQSSAYTSREVIANVSGLDALIDGHSHTEIEKELAKDRDGRDVLLTQTGSYFGAIGKMTITPAGIDTQLLKTHEGKDAAVDAMSAEWIAEVTEMLGKRIGTLGASLVMNDSEGKRLVRVAETNLGNFVADGYYYYINQVEQLECDAAIVNGGGLRAEINAGDVSYMDFKSTNPFGNVLCVIELTGRQIIDALEWGARSTTGVAGENEQGAFLHASGLTYSIDTSLESSVQSDDQGIFTGAPTGAYRVKDVKIYDKASASYVDIDPDKTYRIAGANFTLRQMGDGFSMLDGTLIKDYIVEDYMALATYAAAFGSKIDSANSPLGVYDNFMINYENPLGAGRITVIK